jgi:hypothetical protein
MIQHEKWEEFFLVKNKKKDEIKIGDKNFGVKK